jgi:hypothetical protein
VLIFFYNIFIRDEINKKEGIQEEKNPLYLFKKEELFQADADNSRLNQKPLLLRQPTPAG